MWDYTDKVMDLFHNPHNMGAIATEDCGTTETIAVGEIGSIVCGDALRLYLRIDTTTDTILEARFQTFGCASAIASSSALTDLIKGMTVDDALRLTNRQIASYLGGLPQEKMHCSVMGQEALEAAISNYKGVPVRPEEEDESPLVCSCFGVSSAKIKRLIRENYLTTAEEVTNYIKAGGGCGSCLADIDDLVIDVTQEQQKLNTAVSLSSPIPQPSVVAATPSAPSTSPRNAGEGGSKTPSTLTNLQKITLIQQVLEAEVRPTLAYDGGDVELYDVEGDLVKVVLKGSCDGCPSVMITLKMAIEKRLQERVSPTLIVEAVV
ncbi:MAG: Fe-S cluster assembly protein NifU [Coleofasciculus sp. G3-WIS-01]|uniref:Fe-S cluster assembly protein NifU n=1 Tax=Coleofasciculus sp. G3-WIS-01 TaxID=3069528 RepID=UPI0032FD74DC